MNEINNPAIRKAMESVAAATAKAEADPSRPIYHFRPPANWMNDPNGPIFHNGYYHLFYQHNPYGDAWNYMHWGHARSSDLVHWEHMPIALWPSQELGEEHCFSGCAAVSGGGQPMLFYTKVGPEQDGVQPANEQWAALGDRNWITWQKYATNPILSLENHGGPAFDGDWRDPFIFVADERTFMVLGATYADVAGVALYEAVDTDLTHWRYRRMLYRRSRNVTRFFECPNFFPIGQDWVLLTAPYGPIEYQVGDFNAWTLTFEPKHAGILDPSYPAQNTTAPVPLADVEAHYYATNTLYDPDGQCVLLAWVRGFAPDLGWNGCLALPRILSVGRDGRPRQRPHPNLDALHRGLIGLAGMQLDNDRHIVEGVKGDAIEIRGVFDLDTSSRLTIHLRRSIDGKRSVPIHYANDTLTVADVQIPYTLNPQGRLSLQIFVDKSVLETFIGDGEAAVTRVIEAEPDDVGIELAATGGPVKIIGCDIWEMDSIWSA